MESKGKVLTLIKREGYCLEDIMKKETKIAFIGEEGSIEIFKVFGADVFPVSGQGEAYEIIEQLISSNYGVIFITEDVFDRELFSRYMMKKKLVVVPSLKSRKGKGYQIVNELIRKATGMKE
ncbi:MAG: V-type ATP synthase subunit F [Candidatus Ratteibacteria bacterium]|nr:V-type ATP synthase subunit F [Candidatus Ratteibacteria bacterium]